MARKVSVRFELDICTAVSTRRWVIYTIRLRCRIARWHSTGKLSGRGTDRAWPIPPPPPDFTPKSYMCD